MSSLSWRGASPGWQLIAYMMLAAFAPAAWGQDAQSPAPSPAIVFPTPQTAGCRAAGDRPAALCRPTESNVPLTSLKQLLSMGPAELDFLYQSHAGATLPCGKVRGRVILFPGTGMARPASSVGRLVWQGKVFMPDGTQAVNRFFGVRMIKGRVYQGSSWVDGQPSLILDYQSTSWVYRNYRDEIREVAPGLYLGLMYARTQPVPKFKMYFAFEATP